jgi:IS5 family transposase
MMASMGQITLGVDPLPKKTRKEVFLDEMNAAVPWAALVALVQPHVRGTSGLGRPAAVPDRDDAAHPLPAAAVEPGRSHGTRAA